MFRGKQQPEEGGGGGEAFLTALAVDRNVASSAQNPAPNVRVAAHGVRRRCVRDVDWDRHPLSDPGFDYELPCD